MNRILSGIGLAALCSLSACSTSSTGRLSAQQNGYSELPQSVKPDAGKEQKTVKVTLQQREDLKDKLNDWAREGWMVLSVSPTVPQPDGTYVVTANLAR